MHTKLFIPHAKNTKNYCYSTGIIETSAKQAANMRSSRTHQQKWNKDDSIVHQQAIDAINT